MQKFWRTRQFETLKKEWEAKLEDSGFKDIEEEVGGERILKQAADYAYRRKEHTEVYRETKLTYFMLIAQWMASERNFEDDSDRLIMQRTSEGRSIKEISQELRTQGKRKHNRDTIRYIRRRYEARWGIRMWKPEEMVSRRVRSR